MPIYVYHCKDGHETEQSFPINAIKPKEIRCGTCKRQAKRVYSPPSLHFRGGGFFCTDYR